MITVTARHQHQLYRCDDASTDRINQGKYYPVLKGFSCRFPSIYIYIFQGRSTKQRHLHIGGFFHLHSSKEISKNFDDVILKVGSDI